MKLGQVFIGGALALSLPSAAAAAVTWTDWQQAGANTVSGTVGGVGVTFSGSYGFAQTNGGTDYWNTSSVSTWDGMVAPPPGSDIIALNAAGAKTITFSSEVTDVYLAIMSWQGQTNVVFDRAFTLEGWVKGCGFWGCGLLNQTTPISFSSANEAHGILKFAGPVTSLTFTDSNSEYWHGIQVGVGSAGPVPEPSTWALLILGFGLVGGAMRRRQQARLAFG